MLDTQNVARQDRLRGTCETLCRDEGWVCLERIFTNSIGNLRRYVQSGKMMSYQQSHSRTGCEEAKAAKMRKDDEG
jgi:hypothetical protein